MMVAIKSNEITMIEIRSIIIFSVNDIRSIKQRAEESTDASEVLLYWNFAKNETNINKPHNGKTSYKVKEVNNFTKDSP